jgi:hypothetical protein
VDQNAQYLKILSIFHFIVAAITALFACFPIIFLIGLGMLGVSVIPGMSGEDASLPFPFSLIGSFFIGLIGSVILGGWIFAVCQALSGYFLLTRKHYLFCLIVAGIECGLSPLGTALGVFTFFLLFQPAVREMFGIGQPVAG